MPKTPGGRINDLLKYRLTGQKMTERRVRTYGLYIVLVNRLFPPPHKYFIPRSVSSTEEVTMKQK